MPNKLPELLKLCWPFEQLGTALEVLARTAGLKPRTNLNAKTSLTIEACEGDKLDDWFDWAAASLGVESEAVETNGAQFQEFLRKAGPAVLRVSVDGLPRFLLLLKTSGRAAWLVGPDLRIHRCALQVLSRVLLKDIEIAILADVRVLLQHANIPPNRRPRVEAALLAQRLEARTIDGFWLLRGSPATRFEQQLSQARLPRYLLGIIGAFTCVHALEASGWVLIGHGALNGRLDPGWLVAWVLILLSMVPFQLVGRWLQGLFSIRFGSLLKRRLLHGALQMNPDSVREMGAGRLLGQVIESSVFDSLALNGGFSVLVATIELCLAAWVLSLGANGVWPLVVLASWIVISGLFIWHYYRCLRSWTHHRMELTHDLVERMVGHRTRLAQESSHDRHRDEDRSLEQYIHVSRAFDHAFAPLPAALPRGWLIAGLLALAPEVIASTPETLAMAIGVGGVLLAYRAFSEIASGLASLARAFVAWEQIAPLFHAGKESARFDSAFPIHAGTSGQAGRAPGALLRARNLVYRYKPHGEAVISNCDVTIFRGDRLLLEGPSGGGKSTLAALLVGLRQPESGLLLLNGLDPATLGNSWRQYSTAAPQFHQNHIFSGTLAFNLLMGRRWPAHPKDIAEAEQLCRDLGLGALLDAMPSGILQMVGETGWQLSHGERSRLFLARALLQKAPLVVLDESFAALDPESLDQCLRCALTHADTLLVIAHP